MELTPKQQTSEAIRQAETILILTGQHPSVDQVAAVTALGAILSKFGKKPSAVISDALPASVSVLDTSNIDRNMSGMRDFILKLDVSKAEVDKLRYEVEDGKLNIYISPFKGGFAPSDVTFDYGNFDYDLAIILGVPTRARIDRLYEQQAQMFEKIPVINLDFHRSNENYGAVNLIEPNASSLCEMLVALAESLQGGIIDGEIATSLLTGIMASTDRFTASHTTSKSLTVAAQMMAAGARQQAVVRSLYRDGRGGGDNRSDSRRDARGNNQNTGGNQATPDRSAQSAGNTSQNSRNQPAPTSTAEPVSMPPASAERSSAERSTDPRSEAASMPVLQTTPATMAFAPEPQPVLDSDPMPIIQPSHIELSTPDMVAPPIAPLPNETVPMAGLAGGGEIPARLTQPQPERSSNV